LPSKATRTSPTLMLLQRCAAPLGATYDT
jgi:hypothetical protein